MSISNKKRKANGGNIFNLNYDTEQQQSSDPFVIANDLYTNDPTVVLGAPEGVRLREMIETSAILAGSNLYFTGKTLNLEPTPTVNDVYFPMYGSTVGLVAKGMNWDSKQDTITPGYNMRWDGTNSLGIMPTPSFSDMIINGSSLVTQLASKLSSITAGTNISVTGSTVSTTATPVFSSMTCPTINGSFINLVSSAYLGAYTSVSNSFLIYNGSNQNFTFNDIAAVFNRKLYVPEIRPNMYGNAMTVGSSYSGATEYFDFKISSDPLDKTALVITPYDANGNIYIKALMTGKTLVFQNWYGGGPTQVANISDNGGFNIDKLVIGTTGNGTQGSLKMSGTDLQVHNGSSYNNLLTSASLPVIMGARVVITNSAGSLSCYIYSGSEHGGSTAYSAGFNDAYVLRVTFPYTLSSPNSAIFGMTLGYSIGFQEGTYKIVGTVNSTYIDFRTYDMSSNNVTWVTTLNTSGNGLNLNFFLIG